MAGKGSNCTELPLGIAVQHEVLGQKKPPRLRVLGAEAWQLCWGDFSDFFAVEWTLQVACPSEATVLKATLSGFGR